MVKKQRKDIYEARIFQSLPILLGVIILLISFTIYLALIYHNNFKRIIIEQWNQQLVTTTNILSVNLESFIEKFSENLVNVAHNPVIQKRTCNETTPEDENYCPLENLYKIHENEIDAIVLTDKEGWIIKRFPQWKDSLYIPKKKCPRGIEVEKKMDPFQVYISEIYLNKVGEAAISISVPVFYKGEFSGVVRWMVSIETISDKFVNTIKVGKNGYMWITDQDGKILAHHDKELIGENVSYLIENPESLSHIKGRNYKRHDIKETSQFFEEVFNKEVGNGNYVDFAHKVYCLASYEKVKIGQNSWILIMSLPYAEIVSPIRSHAFKTFILAAIISTLIIMAVINFYKIQKKKVKLEIETRFLGELAKSEEALRKERSKRLTAVIDGQEMERSRISRELHDGIGQILLAIKVKLEQITKSGQTILPEKLHEIRSMFISTIDEVKRISDNLLPVSLDDLGLSNAIQNLCHDVSKTNHFNIDFVSHGIPEDLNSKIKTYLYRISQEALNNVVKHSNASEVNVQLLGNNEQITLIVQDNGNGFEYNENMRIKGNGLNNIKERVTILNGILDISSKMSLGTTMIIKIPLN
ncbi:cache domain-containing protein [Bacteroidota bacterium]